MARNTSTSISKQTEEFLIEIYKKRSDKLHKAVTNTTRRKTVVSLKPIENPTLPAKLKLYGLMKDVEARAKFCAGQPPTMQLAMNVDGTFLTQTKNSGKDSQLSRNDHSKTINTTRTSVKEHEELESDRRSSMVSTQPPRRNFNHHDFILHAAEDQEQIFKQMFKNEKDREISELPALKNQAERLALKMGFDKEEYI